MSTSQRSPIEDRDAKATLRARVVELERENDLLKQAQRAHTEAGGGRQTSGTEEMSELGSLQHICTVAPIGLCCLDTKLRYVLINEWLAEINGLSVEEHLGRSISEVLPDVAAGVEAQLRGVIETGEPVVEGTVTAETAAEPGVKRHFQHNYDAVRSADGIIVGVSCVVQDISERKRAEEALRLIVKGTSWAFGEDFFRSLTRHLALALEVRFAFVSELHEGSESRLRLVANWEGHDFGENFEYDVEGTPCELVIEKGLAYYPANVQQLFPDDRWLKESRIESYLAVSLLDLEGNPLGHLGVADDKPMPKSRLAESILRIFAARAGAELLRKRAEALLRHTQFAVEHSSDSIYWVRSDGRITYANRAACRALGYSYDELVSMSVADIDPDFPEEAWPAQFAKMKTAGSMTFEAHDRTKEGRIVPVEILSNYLDFEGEEYVCAYVRDITERKRAEAELKRFRAALDICADAVLLIDRSEMRFTDVNDTACTALGYTREELLRLGPHDVKPEYTKEELERRFDQVIQCKAEPSAIEIIHQRKDGSQFPAEVSMRALEIGDKHYLLAVVRDITERKRAEEAVQESEALFRGLAENIREILFVVDHDRNNVLYVNRAYEEVWGRTCKSLYEQPLSWADAVVSDDRERVNAAFERQQRTGEFDEEFRIIRPDGSVRWIHERVVPILSEEGKPFRLVGLAEDITERKRAEEALSASETRFRTMFESSLIAIALNHEYGRFIETNPAFQKMFGYSAQELERMTFSELTYPEDVDRGWKLFRELIEGQRDSFHLEKRYYRKDRTLFWGSVSVSAIRNEDGSLRRTVAMVKDITERRRTEEALRESEVKYRELFESAYDVICLVDGEGNIVDINRRGELVTGYSRGELRGMNLLRQLVVPEDRELPRWLLERAAPGEEHVYEMRWRTKDGRTIHFEGASTFRFSPTGEFLFTRCTLRDITERKRAEEQTRQLQADLAHMSRLSSMGEMATGLAHELNQPLTAITNYAQGCVRRLKSNAISEDELERILGRIATQARRSGSIIRGLENLVRKSSALRTDIDVNQSIMEVAELASAEAAQHHAKARFELEPNLPLVMADQTQLQQVILNLVQNGCEAIEDPPTHRCEVTVRTKQRGDRELEISVSDNGRGIAESLGERLFEPFFTTKPEGIGMGLAISRSIVESHGGRLWATPNRGKGTTFHFTLPIVGGHGGDE